MFKENFIRLCNKENKSPTAVCLELGLSNAAFAKWTDATVPRRATLLRIADYFGVSPEDLLSDTLLSDTDSERILDLNTVTDEELVFLSAYRQSTPELQKAARAVLGVSEADYTPDYKLVAFGDDNRSHKNPPKPKIT